MSSKKGNTYSQLARFYREGILTLDNFETLLDLKNGEMEKIAPGLKLGIGIAAQVIPMFQAFRDHAAIAPAKWIPLALDMAGEVVSLGDGAEMVKAIRDNVNAIGKAKGFNQDVIAGVFAVTQKAQPYGSGVMMINALTTRVSNPASPSTTADEFVTYLKEVENKVQKIEKEGMPAYRLIRGFIRNEVRLSVQKQKHETLAAGFSTGAPIPRASLLPDKTSAALPTPRESRDNS